jgi:PII-like signaling protein
MVSNAEFQVGTLMRIFVDECDRKGVQPLYTAVVELLRSRGIAGATVFRGIEGFGGHNEVHIAKVFSWLPKLPILIEVVDEDAKLQALMPDLRSMVEEGLITTESVRYQRLSRAQVSNVK